MQIDFNLIKGRRSETHFFISEGGHTVTQMKRVSISSQNPQIYISLNEVDYDDCEAALRVMHAISVRLEMSVEQLNINLKDSDIAVTWMRLGSNRHQGLTNFKSIDKPDNGVKIRGKWVLDSCQNLWLAYKNREYYPNGIEVNWMEDQPETDEKINQPFEDQDETENSDVSNTSNNTETNHTEGNSTIEYDIKLKNKVAVRCPHCNGILANLE